MIQDYFDLSGAGRSDLFALDRCFKPRDADFGTENFGTTRIKFAAVVPLSNRGMYGRLLL